MLQTALEGLRVLDLSRILAGPWCTQNLADLGAEVIKVESVGAGDDTRGWGPPYLDGTSPEDGFSAYYLCCNRGKRSIAINFALPEGAELIRRLARDADVLVENYKPGTLQRYGLGYEDLKAVNPRLIHLAISGFGQSGPKASQPGYDYVFQGMGGLMSYTGPADGMPGAGPLRSGVAVVDLMSGMYATAALLAAIVQRERTGRGQTIDIALLDVAVAMNANQASNFLVSRKAPKRSGNAHPNCAPYEVFATSDAHLILAIGNDEQFRRFCAVADLPALAANPKFQANAGRIEHLAELRPVLTEALAGRTRQQWADALTAAGVPWGPINTLADVFDDAQVSHRGLRIDSHHPTMGTIPMVRSPFLAQSDGTPAKPPPLRGEHTGAVLREIGLTDEEICRLMDGRVVAEASAGVPAAAASRGLPAV